MSKLGIDLSRYNPPGGDYTKAKAAGVSFAYVQFSYGLEGTDSKAAEHVRDLEAAGIPWGPYHLWRYIPGGDPVAQVDHLLLHAWTPTPKLPIMIDVETEPSHIPTNRVAYLIKGLRELRSRVARRPIVYTYPSYWVGLGKAGLDPEFTEYDLHLAAYTTNPASTLRPPKTPAPWTKRILWQFGGDVNGSRVPGLTGPIDQNVFEGTDEDFAAWVDPPALELEEPRAGLAETDARAREVSRG